MSAFDFSILKKLFGQVADPNAGSLAGDLSQRVTAGNARLVQSTSPGLTGNAAGSVGEQVQRLVDLYGLTVATGLPAASATGSPLQRLLQVTAQLELLAAQLLSTTPNAQAANAAGSLAQQIAQAAVNTTVINRIQYGSITVLVAAGIAHATATATVTSVNTTKAVLIPLGNGAQEAVPTHTPTMVQATWELTNATTVTVHAYTKSDIGGNVTYRFCLVEFA